MPGLKTHRTTNEWIAAAEANLTAKSLSFASLPGSSIFGPNPHGFTTGLHIAGYNGIVNACFTASDVDDQIEAIILRFQARELPFTWWTGPSSQPASLGARLQSHGFVHNRDMIGMCAEIDQLSAPQDDLPAVKIEPVTSTEMLQEWLPIYSQGFGTPPSIAAESLRTMGKLTFEYKSGWKHFLLREQGKIIAISSLFINDHIAGLYNLVTSPEARGQGIGAAMTLSTFAAAREMGCQIATLQTTYPNALRLYHRLGFEVYCKFGIYPFLTSARKS